MDQGRGTGLGVRVRDGNVERALAKFKKKIKDAKVLIEYKERMYYKKPSEIRRRDRRLRKKRSKQYENVVKY